MNIDIANALAIIILYLLVIVLLARLYRIEKILGISSNRKFNKYNSATNVSDYQNNADDKSC